MDETIDKRLIKLRTQIEAARQEFDMAVLFHEVWKPMAYDDSLHARMGASLASNAFSIIKVALRREMLLALGRVWDPVNGAPQLERAAHVLNDKKIRDQVLADRVTHAKRIKGAERLPPMFWEKLKEELDVAAVTVISILEKWSRGGSQNAARERFKALRNQFLAHRQVELSVSDGDGLSDQEVEEYFSDTSKLIELLLNLCLAVSYNPADTGDTYRRAAELFWAGVRGEKTEGHPNFIASSPDRC